MQNNISLTAIVPIKNEAKNLQKCLTAISFASRIIVLDSNSSDGSVEIAKSCGAEIVNFNYSGGYPRKRQWALDTLTFDTEWIIFIDADEFITADLKDEIISTITTKHKNCGYFITKQFHFLGMKLKYGGYSFESLSLFRLGSARFERLTDDFSDNLDMEVHERMIVTGPIGRLKNSLMHEDFNGLTHYITKHNHYSTWEANLRFSYLQYGQYGISSISPNIFGNFQEVRRFFKLIVIRLPFEGYIWFLYHYFFRLGFLDGTRGLIAARFRKSYIDQVNAKIFEKRLQSY